MLKAFEAKLRDGIRMRWQPRLARAGKHIPNADAQVWNSPARVRAGMALIGLFGLLAVYLHRRQRTALKLYDQQHVEALDRQRHRIEQQVKQRTASLTELATHLQQVREEERGDLARELHDELGSLLTAAKLDVARLKSRLGNESPDIAQRIQHLTETLNSGIALKRRIIEELRPSSLSNLGLVASLEILVREFADRSGLMLDSDLERAELSESAQLTVYRLVQESLTNIAKHAQATEVTVALKAHASHVEVVVRDNGRGIGMTQKPRASHGLAGLRHRIEALGGCLDVDSDAHGTAVSALLPKLPP